VGVAKSLSQRLPIGQREHQAKVRHGHHPIAHLAGELGREGLAQMQRQLVAKKIEVDPGVGAAALDATENAPIEAPGNIEIDHMEGEVKQAAHGASVPELPVIDNSRLISLQSR
jgi:hypothetical protein